MVFLVVVAFYFNVLLLCPCRLWESLLALAFSCWLPLPSSSWPLPSYSAASASAAKAMMTHCQPKKKTSELARGAASRMGLSIFVLFHPFYIFFSHPTSFESFLLFWAQPVPAQAAWGSIALHEGGMAEKRPYMFISRKRGAGVKG